MTPLFYKDLVFIRLALRASPLNTIEEVFMDNVLAFMACLIIIRMRDYARKQ
jgi:hypothetical protein